MTTSSPIDDATLEEWLNEYHSLLDDDFGDTEQPQPLPADVKDRVLKAALARIASEQPSLPQPAEPAGPGQSPVSMALGQEQDSTGESPARDTPSSCPTCAGGWHWRPHLPDWADGQVARLRTDWNPDGSLFVALIAAFFPADGAFRVAFRWEDADEAVIAAADAAGGDVVELVPSPARPPGPGDRLIVSVVCTDPAGCSAQFEHSF